ncbi:putative MFS aflatoxin efflux pump [Lindgomyces ingoldianus]|uniref:MFS aflatoxin efflux pump n=1 Tax=Lindgomyces ingoldianus TaxID=673940 RepID=A0ACB6QYY7_9PLEO|nr:putative MFS aflatoxin efflux pump [Lindgomyces ingoldianus]KAF2472126.1 putative MFS aflatoxin efflux pump [Lindgomyces ingoldianus]
MVSQHSKQHVVANPPSEAALNEETSQYIHDANNIDPSNASDETFQKQPLTTIVLLTVTSLMAMFLIALDRTIITTAIPNITNDFRSLPDIGWYASAYLMTCGAFQLMFGKIYSMYSVKAVLILSILLFEIGSAICGAAPNSIAFIIGRSVAGIGAAGILAGSAVTITRIVPLKKQPGMNGLLGTVFGIAIILGPLIGGALTSNTTWRWCFYINLPIGGVVMLVRAFTIKVPNSKTVSFSWREKLWQLDPLGALCLIPGVICLVLALQWGGQAYAWNSSRLVALLTVMSILLVSFVAVQVLLPKTAMVPSRLFKQRSVVAGLWQMSFIGAGMYVIIYYLPVWFQTVKDDSAVKAGIKLLPLMLSMLVGSIVFGGITQKLGYYTPVGILGVAIMAVGAGLFVLLEVDTGHAKWIGYQVVFGFGMGLSMQTPIIAIQTVLSSQDVPVGMALLFFGQLLGGAIGVPIGTNILDNQLLKKLTGVSGFNELLVTSGGVTGLISSLPPELKPVILKAYNAALQDVFKAGVILTASAFLGVAGLEWKSTRQGSGDGAKSPLADEEKNS